MDKKYKLTPEHQAQLEPWRDRWIANAMSTKPMDDAERAATVAAVHGLYEAAKLPPPKHVVFVPSPFVLAFAGGYSSAIWHLRNTAATEPATGAATWAATEPATWDATESATWAATWAATRAATESATWDEKNLSDWFVYPLDLQRKIASTLLGGNAEFGLKCAAQAYRMWNGGNQWSGYPSYLSFFRHVASLQLDYTRWQHYEALALVGPRIMHADFCMVSDRPEVLLVDDRNRPHCDDGPFCRWRDGAALYAIHGTRVPAWIVERPQQITVAAIDSEDNAETRRVMIDRYRRGEEVSGAVAYCRDGGAKVLERSDDHGLLLCRDVAGDEPIIMVQVLNPTPEPDGPLSEGQARAIFGDVAVDVVLARWPSAPMFSAETVPRFKQYFLRVHPELRPMKNGQVVGKPQEMTALNAVASTWGLTGEQFAPMQRG